MTLEEIDVEDVDRLVLPRIVLVAIEGVQHILNGRRDHCRRQDQVLRRGTGKREVDEIKHTRYSM
jgi:hypothetical protein